MCIITSQQLTMSAMRRAVDDMGSRIDELEKSIGELMTQAGIEESQPQLTAGD